MSFLHAIALCICSIFRPSNFWLTVLLFLLPSVMCISYSAPRGNIPVDFQWSLIGKTVLQLGVIYLNVVPLIRRSPTVGIELFAFLMLLLLSISMLVGAWVVWRCRGSEWVDVVMCVVDILLFIASAQWLLAVEDGPTFVRPLQQQPGAGDA